VLIGAAALLWSWTPAREVEQPIETAIPILNPAESSTAQNAQSVALSVQRAMGECDIEATKNPFGLYFLVTAAVPGSAAPQSKDRPADDYETFSLTTSTAMLDGLRDGSLTLNTKPFRYSIIDSASGKTKTWNVTAGVSKISHDDNVAFSKFKVGVDASGKAPKWSNEYSRRTGTCYWVNIRLPGK
ncbi:MAG: hypothetical protein WCG92_15020, partial [Hyphomicrobiales bacterium]